MTDVVGRGLARETIGASEGEVRLYGLVRETVVVQASPDITVILSGLVREVVVVPGVGVMPSGARQYAVSIIG